MTSKAQLSRDRILDAAGRLLVREGGDAVTIAAVAREARVSKGGLFYHFASKEALFDGLVARYVESFDRLIVEAGEGTGAATTAYLRSAERAGAPGSQAVLALLSAAMVHPRSLEALRRSYDRWQQRLDADGIPAPVADLVRFTVDGLWMADLLELAPARGRRRAQVIEQLREIVAAAG